MDPPECSVVGDNKTKGGNMGKGSLLGNAPRKKLADISNMPQRPKPHNQVEKPQSISVMSNDYVEQLRRENVALMQALSDRNKIVELSGIELHKLRVNLQKLQQQNLQLAQANSQMFAELNSGKDRLKALQHELGCKNGLLKARKLELEEKANLVTSKMARNKVGKIKCEEAGESSQAYKGDDKPCNTNRRRQSKNPSLGPSSVKQIQAKENFENKRLCLRRQSARFKSEESVPTEDSQQRQEPMEDSQQEQEPKEDSFEIDDSKNPVHPLRDDMANESGLTLAGSSVKKEDSASWFDAQESRRSTGRPLRRASGKIQSYKEIPLNVKMRRPE